MAVKGTYKQLVCDTEEERESIVLRNGDGATCMVKTIPRKFYAYVAGAWELIPSGEVFPSKTDQGLKYIRVNAEGTAFEYVTLAGGGDMIAANNLSDVVDEVSARDNIGAEEAGAAAAAQTNSHNYTDSEIDTLTAAITALLLGKSNTGHAHLAADISDFQSQVSLNADVAAIKAIIGSGIADGDSVVNTLSEMLAVFSTYAEGTNIATIIAGKAELVHAHTIAQITDFVAGVIANAPAETLASLATLVNSAASKSTPVDADSFIGNDVAGGNVIKRFTWANIKATLKNYFDTVYTTTAAVALQITAALAGYLTTATAATTYAAIAINSSYRTILDSTGSHIAARVAGTYGIAQGNPLAISGTGTLYALNTIYIDAADFPSVGGVTPKLRVRAQVYVNDVAPTGTYIFALHPITRPGTSGGAGLNIYTIGAAVVGSTTTTLTTPAADSMNRIVSADFALPADGHYVLGMVQTGTVAANSHLHISTSLQIRNA